MSKKAAELVEKSKVASTPVNYWMITVSILHVVPILEIPITVTETEFAFRKHTWGSYVFYTLVAPFSVSESTS